MNFEQYQEKIYCKNVKEKDFDSYAALVSNGWAGKGVYVRGFLSREPVSNISATE